MSITFSAKEQAALIGHAILEASLWENLDSIGATKEWLVDPATRELWPFIDTFRKKHSRPPTQVELISHIENTETELKVQKSIVKTVNDCVSLSSGFGLDILLNSLTGWMRARILVTAVHKMRDAFNSGNEEDAHRIAIAMATDLQRVDAAGGYNPDHLEGSATRVKKESEQRKNEGEYLKYGISYLDDATGGIGPHDLVLLGAKTGAGKSSAIMNIAMHNAEQGRKVAVLALEAEDNELERKIKYQLMARKFKHDNKGTGYDFRQLSYGEWRLNQLPVLDRYEAEVDAEIAEKYSTLKTYYRIKSDFGIRELEREVYKIHKDVDLIMVDHIHYLDASNPDNENAELKSLTKRLRHIALGIGVPIIVVAHLRKTNVKELVPSIDDYHGSSDLTKIATSAIMIAPAYDIVSFDEGTAGLPTFIRLVKHRLEGARTTKTAIAFYDQTTNKYTDKYALGHLNFIGSAWIQDEEVPPWAKNCTRAKGVQVDE